MWICTGTMESLKRFCNSVPVYFTKFKSNNATINKHDENESGEEELLHSDYLCNVLAREQVAKFYNAADNAEYLFRNGAFRIKLASEAWKVDSCKPTDEGRTLTKMGAKLIEITSILENLLQRDPFLFYTTGERALISQLLVPLNKSMGKLERKITRLCQGVESHRKVISELALRYKVCEEDQTFYIEADESDTESTMDTAVVLNKREPDKLNKKFQRLWFFLTCTTISDDNDSTIPSTHPQGRIHRRVQSKQLLCKDELIGFRTAHTSQDFILCNTPYSKVSECVSTVESLCPPMKKETANFIAAALTPPVSLVSNFELDKENIDDWRKLSYEKVLENTFRQGPVNIETFDFETFARLTKKIDQALSGDYSEESFDIKYEKHVSIKSPKESGNQNSSPFVDCKYEMGSTCYTQDTNKDNCNIIDTVEEIFDEKVEYTVADTIVTICVKENGKSIEIDPTKQDEEHNYTSENEENDKEYVKTEPGENLGRFPLDPMTCYEYNVSDMLSYINDLTNCLRSLENYWLQPFSDEKIKGKSQHNKELAEIVDYLLFTMNLLEDPLFMQQIYPEDKEKMIETITPVADAVISCSNAFVDLTRLILIDAQYLQKVVEHFPIHETDIMYDHFMPDTIF